MSKQEKEPPNFVHQNAILCETIHKEQRTSKLYTNYSVNPFKKSELIFSGLLLQCFSFIHV
jgi:hypothetical protein